MRSRSRQDAGTLAPLIRCMNGARGSLSFDRVGGEILSALASRTCAADSWWVHAKWAPTTVSVTTSRRRGSRDHIRSNLTLSRLCTESRRTLPTWPYYLQASQSGDRTAVPDVRVLEVLIATWARRSSWPHVATPPLVGTRRWSAESPGAGRPATRPPRRAPHRAPARGGTRGASHRGPAV